MKVFRKYILWIIVLLILPVQALMGDSMEAAWQIQSEYHRVSALGKLA
jgi:hypothetical protein